MILEQRKKYYPCRSMGIMSLYWDGIAMALQMKDAKKFFPTAFSFIFLRCS